MQTELGVRGGPSLSLFLARAETILVIDVRLLWCGPDFVGSLVGKAWYVGVLWLFFPMPGMWACFLLVLLLAPGCGVLLDYFCWLCPYVGFWFC